LSTTLLTGMTAISLHMQWPPTSQSHGRHSTIVFPLSKRLLLDQLLTYPYQPKLPWFHRTTSSIGFRTLSATRSSDSWPWTSGLSPYQKGVSSGWVGSHVNLRSFFLHIALLWTGRMLFQRSVMSFLFWPALFSRSHAFAFEFSNATLAM
jgi:hypothetical protein